jgi:flagellar motor switch/type III secretory pathway protein FliN
MAERGKTEAGRWTGFEALPLEVRVLAGRARCRLAELSRLEPGHVVRLDRLIGEPFELRAGSVLLGRVEPVVEDGGVAVKLVAVPEDDDGSAD